MRNDDEKDRLTRLEVNKPVDRQAEIKERVPLDEQGLLDYYDTDPGYVYRFVNDSPGRIDRFLRAGWVLEEGDTLSTYRKKGAGLESQKSSGIWRTVNYKPNARCKEAVLMKLPKELYDEDQMRKIDRLSTLQDEIDQKGVIVQNQRLSNAPNMARRR